MILGNKCDMEDKRAISRERGEAIAHQHGIRFFETSAKANINVERAFYELTEAILDKQSKVSNASDAFLLICNSHSYQRLLNSTRVSAS